MILALLVSLLNMTGSVPGGLQQMQLQTLPALSVPPPPCGLQVYPYEGTFSTWNRSMAQVVCRTPALTLQRWNGTMWMEPVPLPPLGTSLKTTSDTFGQWWISAAASSAPSAGGNSGQRSVVYDGMGLRPILNTTSITVQDIQWANGNLYVMGTTADSATGGIGLSSAGVGILEQTRGSVVWLPGLLRTGTYFQAFQAPLTPTGPLYLTQYGSTQFRVDAWGVNTTTGLWNVQNQILFRTPIQGQIQQIRMRDGVMYILAAQLLVSLDTKAGLETTLMSVPTTKMFVSMTWSLVQVPATSSPTSTPSPSALPLPTESSSSSNTPSPTSSLSDTPSPSPTQSPSTSSSSSLGASQTSTPTQTLTPTATATPTPSLGASQTSTPTPTVSLGVSRSSTSTPTPTSTSTISLGVSQSSTSSPTQTPSPTVGTAPNGNAVGSSTLSPGAQAGIGFGVIAGVVGAAGIGFFVFKSQYPTIKRYFRPSHRVPSRPSPFKSQQRAQMLKTMQSSATAPSAVHITMNPAAGLGSSV